MKKWYVALVCILVLCVAGGCAAMADQAQGLTIEITAHDPAQDADLFSYDASDGTYTIRSDYDFDVTIDASGADSVRLILGDGNEWDLTKWEAWNDGSWGENHENIQLQAFFTQSSGDDDDDDDDDFYEFFAEATYPGEDPDHEPHQSQHLQIRCWAEGSFPAESWKPAWKYTSSGNKVVLNVSDGTAMTDSFQVTQGQIIQLTGLKTMLPQGASGLWGGIAARKENDEPDWSQIAVDADWDEDQGTLSLFTAFAEPGDYYLALTPWKMGYDRVTTLYPLTVTERQSSGEGPLFIYSVESADGSTDIVTGQEITISACAPEAGWIDVLYDAYREFTWRDSHDSTFVSVDTPYWAPGTYYMVLEAFYPVYDENDQPVYELDENGNQMLDESGNPIIKHDPVASDPIRITVGADGTVDIGGRKSLPAWLAPGDGLEIFIPPIEGVEWMDLDVRAMNGDGSMWDDPLFYEQATENGISLQVSWDDLLERGIDENANTQQALVISANGGKAGYEVRGWSAAVPIVNLQDDTGAEALISFDDTEESEYTAYVNTDVRLTISAKQSRTPKEGESAEIQGVRFYGSWTFRDVQPDENGHYAECVNLGEPGTYSLYAEVTYTPWDEAWDGRDDDPRVWYPTNVLTLHLNSSGTVDAFDFADSQAREITAVRGEPVVFTLEEAQAGNENADLYWIDVFPAGTRDGLDPDRAEDGTAVTLYTDTLPEGDYVVWGRAVKTGWISRESASCVLMHVTAPAEKSLSLNIQYTHLVTQEHTRWFAYAPDAVSIVVEGYMGDDQDNQFFEYDSSELEDPTFLRGENNFGGHAGTAHILATATFADGSTVTRGPVEIEVSAPYGDLAPGKVFSAPYNGSHANFDVDLDGKTEWYVINVYVHDEQTGTASIDPDLSRTGEGGGTVNLDLDPANGAHIGVEVYQAACGYNDSFSMVWVRPLTEEPVLQLPEGLTSLEEEAFAENPAIAGVSIPASLRSIGARAFDGCGRLWAVVIPETVTEIGEDAFMHGNVTIYGEAGSAAESYARNYDIDFVGLR